MLPKNYRQQIEQREFRAGTPYNQPAHIIWSPRPQQYWSGIRMNGVIPYTQTMLSYYAAPKQPLSDQNALAFGPLYGTNRVYSGVAPVSGIYTGVKNG